MPADRKSEKSGRLHAARPKIVGSIREVRVTIGVDDIVIRDELAPGDLGYMMYLHGMYYRRRHGYGIPFESHVALAVHEFYASYDPGRDRVWICEHRDRIIGSLVLMHRAEHEAQLRLFLVEPEYQGIGLGKHLLNLFVHCLDELGYRSAFLWTTDEQEAAIALYERIGFRLTDAKSSTAFGRRLRELRYDLAPVPRRTTRPGIRGG